MALRAHLLPRRRIWDIYDRSWYETLRERYLATKLPTVYDKVKVDIRAKWKNREEWGASWLSTWPIGGLYGMFLATTSGDISLHRQAKWRSRDE